MVGETLTFDIQNKPVWDLRHRVGCAKLKVVAEGVETNEQAGLLCSLNRDDMQGFLLSRPVPGPVRNQIPERRATGR